MNIKEEFRGTGQVFSFTLTQLLKAKGNIVSMIIMVLFALISVPLTALVGGGSFFNENASVKTLYIENKTDLDLTGLPAYLNGTGDYNGLTVTSGICPEDETDAEGLRVEKSEEGLAVAVVSAGKKLSTYSVQLLAGQVRQYVNGQVLKEAGLSEEAAAFLQKPVFSAYGVQGDENPGEEPEEEFSFNDSDYYSQMGYSIILMMFCMYSVSFIIRTVIEEKSSKLVDLLMVSVKPAALLFGKVLAVLVYVVIYMALLIGGMLLSYFITSRFMDLSQVTGIAQMIMNIRITGSGIAVVLITSILGYVFFGLLSGVSGAGCSNMEEASGAMSVSMLLIMAGYMISLFANIGGQGKLNTVLCLLPVTSLFTAPMSFMRGTIGFGIVALSWLLQLICIYLLIRLSARVYSRLIIYNGARLKLTDIVKMARKEEA